MRAAAWVLSMLYSVVLFFFPVLLEGVSTQCLASTISVLLLIIAVVMRTGTDSFYTHVVLWSLLLALAVHHVSELSVVNVFVSCAMLAVSLIN